MDSVVNQLFFQTDFQSNRAHGLEAGQTRDRTSRKESSSVVPVRDDKYTREKPREVVARNRTENL